MWPTLVSIGPVAIHSLGVMLFLGIFFGAFKLWHRAKEEGWEETAVMDAWLLAGAGALLLGRMGFVLMNLGALNNWYKMLFFTKYPGLSGEAAWLGAAAVLTVIGIKRKLDLWLWLEANVPALLLVMIFGYLGGFLAGSALGKPAPAGWGLNFPGVDGARFPVQLIWAGLLFSTYLWLNSWEKRYRAWGWKEGVVVAGYLLSLGLVGVAMSFLEVSAFFGFWWSAGQAVAGGLILLVRSGINIKAAAKLTSKRKKRGFDYV